MEFNRVLPKATEQPKNMIMKTHVAEILSLSVKERLRIVEEIWDSIAASPEEIPLDAAQRKELDRRKREHRQNPSAAKPWSEIKARLEKRHRGKYG